MRRAAISITRMWSLAYRMIRHENDGGAGRGGALNRRLLPDGPEFIVRDHDVFPERGPGDECVVIAAQSGSLGA
ncbi:hypothetical protein AA23498_2274 [Acetobacter nitrogenifigens DSM 23921 = NBRC 105050]|nr:hypothetical protein AA23498_2274 [Acetobacter nitrogenifigens DSM 23921 = NBRC 105050]